VSLFLQCCLCILLFLAGGGRIGILLLHTSSSPHPGQIAGPAIAGNSGHIGNVDRERRCRIIGPAVI
jgi:hypothetical protein